MSNETPPPLLPTRSQMGIGSKVLIGLALFNGCLIGLLIALRLLGLICPFSIPTGAMMPAVAPGDHVVMENISYLSHQPRRGDIVVFKTDGIASLPPANLYIKRVAGKPGEHVQISASKLFINNNQVSLSNAVGEITYDPPTFPGSSPLQVDVKVPPDSYFVLGDNSTNSLDSRYWGSLPRANITGRIFFCYWPLPRIGTVR